MYTSSNLVIYSEVHTAIIQDIHSILVEYGVPFRKINSPNLILPTIKNPQNYVILIINSVEFLQAVENNIKFCHNFQKRVFIIFTTNDLIDYFFDNFCLPDQLEKLKHFVLNNIVTKNIKPEHQSSQLLYRLISYELENIGIPPKYIGFEYLISILINTFSKNFYVNNYIDLFECVACEYCTKIDTIERDVRHMLVKTWKNSEKFREILSASNNIDKPNSKSLLKAVIAHLKKVI